MYCEGHPNAKVSYEACRKIFNGKFNISFGYPRSDTCSTSNELTCSIPEIGVPGKRHEPIIARKRLPSTIRRICRVPILRLTMYNTSVNYLSFRSTYTYYQTIQSISTVTIELSLGKARMTCAEDSEEEKTTPNHNTPPLRGFYS